MIPLNFVSDTRAYEGDATQAVVIAKACWDVIFPSLRKADGLSYIRR